MADTSLVFNLVARDRASGVVERMGERFSAAAATIGAGIGVALGVGVATSLNMDEANAKLANQLGLNEAEAARVGDVAGAVFADGFGQSVDEVNDALRGVASSMVDVGDISSAELQDLTTKAKVLADTFDYDVNEATQAAGTLMKAGLAKDGIEAFDLMTAAAQKLPAQMAAEIPAMVTEYASFFDELGVSGPQMMGALTEAAKNPLFEIDKLGDAVKEFNLRIADSGAVAAPLKELGLDVADIQKLVNTGKGTQAFDEIVVALAGVKDQTDATRLAAALMGGPGEDAKTSLIGLGQAGGFAKIGLQDAAGATQGLVDRVDGTATHTLQKFKNTALTELADVAAGFINFGMANQGAMVPLMYTMGTLAGVVMAVSVAQKLYATYTAISTAATNLQNTATFRAIAGWTRMMAVGLMAYARIAAGAVASATATAAAWVGSALISIGTWIAAVVRAGVTAAAQFLLMAARAVVWAATMAAQWLIAMGPIGWVIAAVVGLVALIIANWDTIKEKTGAAWDWLWGKIKGVAALIVGLITNLPIVRFFLNHWTQIKTGLANKVVGIIAYVRGLPGRIKGAVGNLGSLLYDKGKNIVEGLWKGIQSMGSWLKGQLTSFARNLVPGPIAKALGIASPSKVMANVVGRWIPAGIVQGIESGQGVLDRTMSTLIQPPSAATAMGVGRQMAGGGLLTSSPAGVQTVRVIVDVQGGDGDFKKMVRKMVRIDGRGSVQAAFGTGG
ncbi:phage tail tape measure protein [Streptomyces sp. NPDC058092]|uniref:phage tail tape measure protein n=1 Tax=Streptomyces sp. NPDC058092 TaxID=3346336 RepID=UPI0036F0FDBC